jgi:hypothetical protein
MIQSGMGDLEVEQPRRTRSIEDVICAGGATACEIIAGGGFIAEFSSVRSTRFPSTRALRGRNVTKLTIWEIL